jgi:PPOX class probable F420-dependent enzyme
MADPVSALADERFVSLTTFRRSGEGVATPVWVAREGGALVVTTGAASGKVKRLRREPRATARPCDRRGRVADDVPEHELHAEIVTDPAHQEQAVGLLARKYGVEWRVLTTVERVVGLFRGGTRDRVILRLTAPPAS